MGGSTTSESHYFAPIAKPDPRERPGDKFWSNVGTSVCRAHLVKDPALDWQPIPDHVLVEAEKRGQADLYWCPGCVREARERAQAKRKEKRT